MILSPSKESKAVLGEPPVRENVEGTALARFPSTAFREPILRALASGSPEDRSTEPFPATAFRDPALRMLARRPTER